MSRSDHATGQISTYRFPGEVSIDGLLVRPPLDADIDEIAPAFRDPAVGGEAGLPPVDADTLRVMLHEQLPGLHAQGLLAAYVIEDTETGKVLGSPGSRPIMVLSGGVERAGRGVRQASLQRPGGCGRISSAADIVSIQAMSAPPAFSPAASSPNDSMAAASVSAPSGSNSSPVGPIEPATTTGRGAGIGDLAGDLGSALGQLEDADLRPRAA